MNIAIIIVNYRTAALTVDCLRSLAEDGWLLAHGRAVVVDNASGDQSLEMITRAVVNEGWQNWVEVVAAERNGGFAYGNNIGIRRAFELPDKPEFIMLLNPDTIVRKGAVETLVRFMVEHPSAGIAGSRCLDGQNRNLATAFRQATVANTFADAARLRILQRILGEIPLFPEKAAKCDWVSGAAMIVRADVVIELGGMDEGFFLYFEEVDFCRRATRKGWEVWSVVESEITHLVAASTNIHAPIGIPCYWYQSRARYLRKHGGVARLLLTDAAWVLGRAFFRIRSALQLTLAKNNLPPRFTQKLVRHDLHNILNHFRM